MGTVSGPGYPRPAGLQARLTTVSLVLSFGPAATRFPGRKPAIVRKKTGFVFSYIVERMEVKG